MEISGLLENIERLHCDFHQKAFEIESVSSLKAALKPLAKEEVSMPTSRWTMKDFLSLKRYSIGSSIVMITSSLVSFMISIRAA